MPIRQRPLDIGYLRTFERLAHHLNYRAVADDMALTQPAVSRQIQALEDDVGATLFMRNSRRVQLTEAGRQLLSTVQATLPRIDATVMQLRQRAQRQTVYVTTFATFASLWLIGRLGDFQQLHPDVDIRIEASDATLDLEAEGVDLALRVTAAAPGGHAPQALFPESATLVASPSLIQQANGALQTLAGLRQHTLIQVMETCMREPITFANWLEHNGCGEVLPARWLTFDSGYQVVQAALGGQGVALVRHSMVLDYLASGALVELWPGKRMPSPPYWLVVNPRSSDRPGVQIFVAWLLQQAEQTRKALHCHFSAQFP